MAIIPFVSCPGLESVFELLAQCSFHYHATAFQKNKEDLDNQSDYWKSGELEDKRNRRAPGKRKGG